jgi:hypothetical protein
MMTQRDSIHESFAMIDDYNVTTAKAIDPKIHMGKVFGF